jgi:cadmium resistance protein CadD (predicted permease)
VAQPGPPDIPIPLGYDALCQRFQLPDKPVSPESLMNMANVVLALSPDLEDISLFVPYFVYQDNPSIYAVFIILFVGVMHI